MPSMQPDEFKRIFIGIFASDSIYHCANENKEEKLKLLKQRGIGEDTVDRFGANVLHYAAQYGDINLIKHLIYLGFKWNLNDNQGFSLLYYAIRAKNDAVIIGLGDLHFGFYLGDASRRTIINYAESHYPQSLKLLKNHYNEAFDYWSFSEKSRRSIFNHPIKNLINTRLPSELSFIISDYLDLENDLRDAVHDFKIRNQLLFPLLDYYIRHPQDNEVLAVLNSIFSEKKSGINNLEQQLNGLLKKAQHGNKPYSELLLQCRINTGEITKNKKITVSRECWNFSQRIILESNNVRNTVINNGNVVIVSFLFQELLLLLVSAPMHILVLTVALHLAFFCTVYLWHMFDYFNIAPVPQNGSLFFNPAANVSSNLDPKDKMDPNFCLQN